MRALILVAVIMIFSGCAMFTEVKVVEVPTYISRPLPILKTYDINSTFKFIGLVKDGNMTKVPTKQFKSYIDLKLRLEKQLEKSNNQVISYNTMVKKGLENE